MNKLFTKPEFTVSLHYSVEVERLLLTGNGVKEREPIIGDAKSLEKAEGLKTITPELPKSFQHNEHISKICSCTEDYNGIRGGNCAHYVANNLNWNIKAGDPCVIHHCPAKYAINAHDMFLHCASPSTSWVYKKYPSFGKKGLVFGWKSEDKVGHVGTYAGWSGKYGEEWVYHYGFDSNKVIRNKLKWWASNKKNWLYYSLFEPV